LEEKKGEKRLQIIRALSIDQLQGNKEALFQNPPPLFVPESLLVK
jgi:hypothetical protein